MASNKKYYLLSCQLALCNTLIALRTLQSKKKKKKKKKESTNFGFAHCLKSVAKKEHLTLNF